MIRTLARWGIIVPIALVAVFFFACGDDDDKGGSSGGTNASAGTGSDEKFVADICKATKKFSDSLNTALKDPASVTDTKKLADTLGKALSTFADDFGKANPPKDAKDWHAQAAKDLKTLADSVKSGKDLQQVFGSNGSPFADPPAAVDARFSKIAATNADCKASGAFN